MTQRLAILVLLVSLSVSASAQAEAEIAVRTLAEPGSSVKWGRAEGVVEASAERVMRVLTDYAGYSSFIPHFRTSRILSQRGSRALVYMEAKIIKGTVTIWAQIKISERKARGSTRIIEGRMMKGNIDQLIARWEVTPLGPSKSKVAFQMLVDPDLPVPSSLVTSQNAKWTKKTLRALREKLGQARNEST